ncbi:MAG: hypothetical protein H0X62_04000, partial [Bacteroidetes bacterium]|nr:hypothetical protein [Bacteroidota bacterium]
MIKFGKSIFYLLSIIGILFFSCKKDRDTSKPVILLSAPFEHQSFQVPGEIKVSGKVDDDKNIEFIRVSLLNEAQGTAAPSQAIEIKGKSTSFEVTIELEGQNLKSGIHYVVITTSDGVNESRLFRKIDISEEPQKLKGVFVVTSDGNTTNVVIIDSSGQKSNFHVYAGNYAGSSLNSFYQAFTIAGQSIGEAISMKIPDKSVLWREAQYNQNFPSFTALNLNDNTNYLSYFTGITRDRDEFGNSKASFDAYPGCYTKEVIAAGERVIAFQKEISGAKKRMCVYFKGTGLFFHQMLYEHDVKALCAKSKDEIISFGNNGGKGSMSVYRVETNSIKETMELAG